MRPRRGITLALLITLIAGALTALSPTAALAYPTPNSRGGVMAQWYYGTDGELNLAADTVKNTGVGWVRIDLKWDIVQPSNASTFDWHWPDTMIAKAQSRGLKVMLVAGYTPSWANGGQSDVRYYPSNVPAWKAFLDAAARRYLPLGVTTFELWNEPNYSPQSSPSLFASNVLKPGSDALRAVSTQLQRPVTIVDGAPASIINTPGVTDPYAWVSGIYANGGKSYFDVQGIHPYSWPLDPTITSQFNHLKRAVEIHDIMAANGDGSKQVWATEYGIPTSGPNTVTEAQQSDHLLKGFQLWTQSAWQSWTGPMFVYTYRDSQPLDSNPADDDPEGHFGLVRHDWTAKPALAQLTNIMSNVAPPAPTPPTSGWGGTPPAGATLIDGFENAALWSGDATRLATTTPKTEGSQSIRVTYPVPASGWRNNALTIGSPYRNISGATELKLDVYPLSQTPAGQTEPITLKLQDQTAGVVYEDRLPRLTANQWTTVTVSLAGIPAASRTKLNEVNLYLWSGFTAQINGRTSLQYHFDNLRVQ